MAQSVFLVHLFKKIYFCQKMRGRERERRRRRRRRRRGGEGTREQEQMQPWCQALDRGACCPSEACSVRGSDIADVTLRGEVDRAQGSEGRAPKAVAEKLGVWPTLLAHGH